MTYTLTTYPPFTKHEAMALTILCAAISRDGIRPSLIETNVTQAIRMADLLLDTLKRDDLYDSPGEKT